MQYRHPVSPADAAALSNVDHVAERARLDARAAERSARRAELARGAADPTVPTHIVVHTPQPVLAMPRRRWAGVIGAGLIGAAVAALIVSNQYDGRSVGQRLDASVKAVETGVGGQVQGIKDGAATVANQGAAAVDSAVGRVAATVNDASITASVKAALATDPALSALAIEVNTTDGIVRLRGPAPDTTARERAGVLAAAPQGVRGVDNQLRVAASS